jgi:hypothetical protein
MICLFVFSPATGGEWTDREICRAATKVYFFLSELPQDAPDQGEHMGFRSAESNYYTCRVDGGVADFRWINKSGEQMNSRVTQFEVQASTLTVKSDMQTEVFERE